MRTVQASRGGGLHKEDHGWVFEIPVAPGGLVSAEPIKAMGRFNHEAAVVDPRSGAVYMTEDRQDSLFYRFVPAVPGQLAKGGRLQALALADPALSDTRNWTRRILATGGWHDTRWIDLHDVESPKDDLRKRGQLPAIAMSLRRTNPSGLGVIRTRSRMPHTWVSV